MTADLTRSNSLVDLAARIRIEHEAVVSALKRGLDHAIAAGLLLIEAKEQLKHGAWLPWLQTCGLSPRTAVDQYERALAPYRRKARREILQSKGRRDE